VGYNVPFGGDSKNSYMSVDAWMPKDSSLMGTFTLPLPPLSTNVDFFGMISSVTGGSHGSFDTWVVPCLNKEEYYGSHMLLMMIDITYLSIHSTSNDPDQNIQQYVELDWYYGPPWAITPPPASCGFLHLDIPSNEAIMEAMALDFRTWNNIHQCMSFLLNLAQLEDDIKNHIAPDNV
jgi:hypothetical protein